MCVMKHWVKIGAVVCGTILIVAGRIGYELWEFSRPAVSDQKLARLNSHMDTNNVAELLGSPTSSTVFTNHLGKALWTSWTYSRPHSWKFVEINFDEDGKFVQHIED
jgi:hypothetical protein